MYKYAQETVVQFEWDPTKAASNLRKHDVRFAEATSVFEDDAMLTMPDDSSDEERFVALGLSSLGREFSLLVTQLGATESESFQPAKPRGQNALTMRREADEERI